MRLVLALLLLTAAPLRAEMLVAARMIPAGHVLGPADVTLRAGNTAGTLDDPALAVGLEARVVLYPGRPILSGDLGAPAVVERNQTVTLIYRQGSLLIATDARALGRAGVGDMLRVMNLASRSTVSGQVDEAGRVIVGPSARTLQALEDF